MSNRRTAAAAASAAAAATPIRTGARSYVAGSGAVTKAERTALADGIKAGAKLAERQRAADALAVLTAIGAERDLSEAEAGALAEATAVLAEADALALANGRPAKWLEASGAAARMQATDVAKLAAYGAACAKRRSRPVLTDDEVEECHAAIMLAILERGAKDARINPRGALPRWDTLGDVEAEAIHAEAKEAGQAEAPATKEVGIRAKTRLVSVTEDAVRARWRGFAFLTGIAWNRLRAERATAEAPADWTEGETTTPEQQAAALADAKAAEVAHALASTDTTHGVYALAAEAPASAPLSGAERDALALALSGLTRADLAATRNVSAEALKKGAQRGRKALERRAEAKAEASAWVRRAARRMDAMGRPAEERPSVSLAYAKLPRARPMRQVWAPTPTVVPYAPSNPRLAYVSRIVPYAPVPTGAVPLPPRTTGSTARHYGPSAAPHNHARILAMAARAEVVRQYAASR